MSSKLLQVNIFIEKWVREEETWNLRCHLQGSGRTGHGEGSHMHELKENKVEVLQGKTLQLLGAMLFIHDDQETR